MCLSLISFVGAGFVRMFDLVEYIGRADLSFTAFSCTGTDYNVNTGFDLFYFFTYSNKLYVRSC